MDHRISFLYGSTCCSLATSNHLSKGIDLDTFVILPTCLANATVLSWRRSFLKLPKPERPRLLEQQWIAYPPSKFQMKMIVWWGLFTGFGVCLRSVFKAVYPWSFTIVSSIFCSKQDWQFENTWSGSCRRRLWRPPYIISRLMKFGGICRFLVSFHLFLFIAKPWSCCKEDHENPHGIEWNIIYTFFDLIYKYNIINILPWEAAKGSHERSLQSILGVRMKHQEVRSSHPAGS